VRLLSATQLGGIRMRRRLVMVGSVAAVLLVGLQFRQAALPPAAAGPFRALCGVERWSVKTFTDADRYKVDLTPRRRTIKQLDALKRPATRPPNMRTPDELKVYRVTATVTTTINEDDGDIHLALIGSDGARLIAEAPEPACSIGARDRAVIDAARLVAQDIQPGDKVIATGVGFWDFAHHQTGHADNYIELHPLISIKRL
jgi:hypothetical protein